MPILPAHYVQYEVCTHIAMLQDLQPQTAEPVHVEKKGDKQHLSLYAVSADAATKKVC